MTYYFSVLPMPSRFLLTATALMALFYAEPAFAAFAEDFALPGQPASSEVTDSLEDVQQNLQKETADLNARPAPLALGDDANRQLTREEFTALIVNGRALQVELDNCYYDITSVHPPRFTLVFRDVLVNDAYARHICLAMRDGLIEFGPSQSFRPRDPITLAEAAKILARAHHLAPYAQYDEIAPWYEHYLRALADDGIIPASFTDLNQRVTLAQAYEMIARMEGNGASMDHSTYESLLPPPPRVFPVRARMDVSAPASTLNTDDTSVRDTPEDRSAGASAPEGGITSSSPAPPAPPPSGNAVSSPPPPPSPPGNRFRFY